MNVNQITDKIKEIAISLETVNSVFEGDVYENWNSTEIKYGSFNVGLQNVSNDGNLCTYTFVFYYSDRLTQDKSNANSIYSDGVNTIQSVINVLNYMQFDISEQINYTPFEQKFMDYLAGVYATVNIVTSSSLGFCNMDDYNIEEVIEIVKNGVYDVTNYTKAVVNVIPQWGTIEGDINEQEDLIELIDGKISPLETRIETVEGQLENLGDFTCGTIEPTTTNFVEGTTYTIHEALQRTANLFEGYQGEIDDINDLIPNQATTQNQLADKAFVNSTVATNAANFRGNWSNWVNVPTDANKYPEDYAGNKTPTNNDYMVVQDAGGFVPSDFTDNPNNIVIQKSSRDVPYGIDITIGDKTTHYTSTNFPYAKWTPISVYIKIRYDGATGYEITGKGTYFVDNVEHISDSHTWVMLNSEPVGTKHYVSKNLAVLPVELNGSWRFIYVGDWTTNGKNGWKPQYQIGSSFTAEQQAAIDSTITANKVATYDGYGTKITALQTDKLDKNYTANKIYGTDSLGAQTVYTLGDGLAFDNGQIKCTRTTAAWGNITGTLSNQTDLQNALDSKQNTLIAGEGIEISGNTISAIPTDNATNDDIDFMFAKEIKLIREQKDNENYIDWLVNTDGETMEYNGQAYYKWVSWANDYNDGVSWNLMEYPNIIVLTNTLDVQLPFNSNSPEFEYTINIDGENLWQQDYIHGDYTKKTFQ